MRTTPEHIDTLKEGEVFVFGSNAHGMHYGGAARTAVKKFGAVMGQGDGLQGQSYAISSMEGLKALQANVRRFTDFARLHPELTFLVTRIGCGIAGYTDEEVAPFFASAAELDNVWLPASFWEILNK
ncbi:MAG: hypothetical protein IJ760_06920 [Bacteroidales bacterium]|nr:hypothetical protein [Bacteroidales bacterium]